MKKSLLIHKGNRPRSRSGSLRWVMLATGIGCASIMTTHNLFPSLYAIKDLAISIFQH